MLKNKKIIGTAFFLILIAVGFSVWTGGKERWDLSGISINPEGNAEMISKLENKLEKEPDSITAKYNLAFFYYQAGKFKEAEELLSEVINSDKTKTEFSKSSFFNLGNTLYRQAEQEKDLTKALELLKGSLLYYRGMIDREKQEQRYADVESKPDPDVLYNYALVRTKIKILQDQLNQQQKEQEKQTSIYDMLKEVIAVENQIKEQLAVLSKTEKNDRSNEIRSGLLQKRQENFQQLKAIKEKISLTFEQQQKGKQMPSGSPPQNHNPSQAVI